MSEGEREAEKRDLGKKVFFVRTHSCFLSLRSKKMHRTKTLLLNTAGKHAIFSRQWFSPPKKTAKDTNGFPQKS